MSVSFIGDVEVFHRKFGSLKARTPRWPNEDVVAFRKRLIVEEFTELIEEGFDARDMTKVADGIADLIYVLVGCALTFGLPLQEVWNEVQKTNMAKEGGPTRADGKILKPEGWTPPDIAAILRKRILETFTIVDPAGCIITHDGSCVGNADCIHSERWRTEDGQWKPAVALIKEREEHLLSMGLRKD